MKKKKVYTFFDTNQYGFSLIELIGVMAVFGVIGTIIVSILVTVLRGTEKADLLSNIRQNGDISMSQLVKSIRYSQALDAPAACIPTVTVNAITITSASDYGQTTYACPANPNNPITSNSASLVDSSTVTVTKCSFTCSQPYAGSPPIITIKYTLAPKNTGSFVEDAGSISFESSVSLRNENGE